MSQEMNADYVRSKFLDSHKNVVESLIKNDNDLTEHIDTWERDEGGGGKTFAYSEGRFMEKGGINFSDVQGAKLPPSALSERAELTGSPFRAMGVSVVFHPINPHVPTAHANIRFFTAKNQKGENVWWFGGGFDLTPYYPVLEDVVFWHQKAKDLCDSYGKSLYKKFKDQCDQYFYILHRKETRGVGGIFFDDLCIDNFDKTLAFCLEVMATFADSYFTIFEKRKGISYTEKEKAFQQYRRGRYVEFNLVYDRGTHFGLQSGGRTESILMSMPPTANWSYQWTPLPGSKEEELYKNFLKPVDWLDLET